jgi:hypothetical protein
MAMFRFRVRMLLVIILYIFLASPKMELNLCVCFGQKYYFLHACKYIKALSSFLIEEPGHLPRMSVRISRPAAPKNPPLPARCREVAAAPPLHLFIRQFDGEYGILQKGEQGFGQRSLRSGTTGYEALEFRYFGTDGGEAGGGVAGQRRENGGTRRALLPIGKAARIWRRGLL